MERLLPENVYMLPASWNHRKIYADCDRNGQWTLALPTPEAGGPYTITFSDGEELTLKKYPDR
ncbi:hypothetical protein NXX91_23600 [Bacteroides thetaiotaomicron]|nr:hypothetical protein [Bacteroides thetaiotaomicron]MCS2902337.1 hypothetical protein [Bacteroides thetaiotaomicron]